MLESRKSQDFLGYFDNLVRYGEYRQAFQDQGESVFSFTNWLKQQARSGDPHALIADITDVLMTIDPREFRAALEQGQRRGLEFLGEQ